MEGLAGEVSRGSTSDYLYDLSNKIFALFGPGCGGTGCWVAGAVYLNGQFLTEYYNSTTYFVAADHLGSSRLLTDLNQNVYDSFDYLPFGEQSAGGSGTNLKFTGDERDAETGLDHTWFRQYASGFGRWMTADPAGLMAASLDSPQSLNRYSYVNNMPLSYFDPTGLCGDGLSDISHAECDGGTGGQGGGGGSAGGGGRTIFGNDEFDAIAGAPGTYIFRDIYGDFHWGFSLGQWRDYYASQTVLQVNWTGGDGSIQEQQRELAATQLGLQVCSGQDATALQGCIQDAYNTMGSSGRNCGMVGGNCNFTYASIVIQETPFDPSNLGCFGGRCGSIDSLHFHTDRVSPDYGTFHVDTANPFSMFGTGGLIHLIFDVIGGNTWWRQGIPRPWWGH